MPRKTKAQANRDRLLEAMTPLVLLPSFQAWIETLRQTKDSAVQYMVHHSAVSNERESLAAIGEVRAYLAIIQDYEAQKEVLEQQMKAEVEQAQQSAQQ